MKVLIFGSDGFIGSNVHNALRGSNTVGRATRRGGNSEYEYTVDLLDQQSIEVALSDFKPEVIVNCAGVVDSSTLADQNEKFTGNIIEAILASELKLQRIIISGSAAEYGVVESLPVREDAPLRAVAGYGLSKVKETTLALAYGKKHNLPVVIARIFNPIGTGMREKFLVPQMIKQVQEIQAGTRSAIEVSRLDAMRDYVSVWDVANAIRVLIEAEPKELVYNIGSGSTVSNGELIDMILKNSKMISRPEIKETSADPEPQIASWADISLINTELGWEPVQPIEVAIKEIMDATR